MSEDPFSVSSQHGLQVILRITSFVSGRSVADLQINHVNVGTVDQLMGDAIGRKARTHTRPQQHFRFLSD
jgi:hypothetical protein